MASTVQSEYLAIQSVVLWISLKNQHSRITKRNLKHFSEFTSHQVKGSVWQRSTNYELVSNLQWHFYADWSLCHWSSSFQSQPFDACLCALTQGLNTASLQHQLMAARPNCTAALACGKKRFLTSSNQGLAPTASSGWEKRLTAMPRSHSSWTRGLWQPHKGSSHCWKSLTDIGQKYSEHSDA